MKIPLYLIATVLILQSLFAQTSPRSIDGVWQGAFLSGQGKVRVVLYVSPPRDGVYSGAMINPESGTGSNIDLIQFANGKVGLELRT